MSASNVRNAICDALAAMVDRDLAAAAANLLAVCGYRSERTLPGQSGNAGDFTRRFPAANPGTQSEQVFLDNAESVQVLFQFTSEEIQAGSRQSLPDAAGFDDSNARSFLFAAVQLRGSAYSRARYAAFTRELNRRFPIPMVVLFRTAANRISLAFVHRRPNQRDPERDVLGSVSLIREIDPVNPHRAHRDILAELSLPERLCWMDNHGKPHNFDGLLEAWLAALDTEELNRSFYRELFRWFEHAVKTARFPADQARTQPAEEHVIRLITRLMFVWFIKEKRLVSEDLFIENRVAQLLKDYDRDNGDSYYRAVLQNLFFATLNTGIDRRTFSAVKNSTHRDFSRYRYRREMADPDALLALFRKTPFINGGLFDCLDSFEATGAGGYRIDCFTDNPQQGSRLSIPNRLFFSGGASNPGLIDLFDRYKFTVEENTPTEQEVALDPELLGKVFENLLAAVNPETQLTARKETGSYYTPRAVVDYMVDEALIATLSQKASAGGDDLDHWQERLRCLLDYAFADAGARFTPAEREAIVRAIAGLKVLDPAVGSGAFPMGVLHKLTLALSRLDDGNQLWEALQRELAVQRATAAFQVSRPEERENALAEISRTFEQYRESDFGRKLYLIQNSIYGVDRQPIAAQIAKLRFFISLAIEQQPNDDPADNYGIRPLPNLETRFVAADTLRKLERRAQLTLDQTPEFIELERELAVNRERHFHANNRRQKQRCQDEDERLRGELAKALRKAILPPEAADRVAKWNPYDQNSSAADWFDAEYMFGVADGFDVVIGNPPYVESRNSLLSDKLKDAYRSSVFTDWEEVLPRGCDLLIYFLARAPKLLHSRGYGCLLTQNAWLTTDYGKKFQDFSLDKFAFQRIIDTSAKFFSDSNGPKINAVVAVFSNQLQDDISYEIVNSSMEKTTTKLVKARQPMKWGHLAAMPDFFIGMLSEMTARAGSGSQLAFGQGLNFPLKELKQAKSGRPIIIKDAQFVATSADGKIGANRISATRKGKIPALIMPRGIGDRYYCAFNACKAFSYSAVELYLPDALWETDLHYCLWAYLNSSLVWLFREVTGRRNLGGGLLKAEATDMKALPVDFAFDFADNAKAIFKALKNREPLPLVQEIDTDEHLSIDQMVFDYFGFSEMQDTTRRELLAQVAFRTNRSAR